MEMTRHFTATVYIVHDGATALHNHKRLGVMLPPGGHIDRDELPHKAGLREVEEETGLRPTLIDTTPNVQAPSGTALPRPRHQMLYDINVHDGIVGHQHIDLIYYATVPSRDITPADGEAAAESWLWFTGQEIRESDLPSDVIHLGIDAIQTSKTGQ